MIITYSTIAAGSLASFGAQTLDSTLFLVLGVFLLASGWAVRRQSGSAQSPEKLG
jgi:hypothetical protein